mmetsp:Transcript_11977/g.17856  ORF Transcript_11977/g.17856 Transcript_11977/m.17856 type:complete len:253 (+) Transcript_11977:463-1221(+)
MLTVSVGESNGLSAEDIKENRSTVLPPEIIDETFSSPVIILLYWLWRGGIGISKSSSSDELDATELLSSSSSHSLLISFFSFVSFASKPTETETVFSTFSNIESLLLSIKLANLSAFLLTFSRASCTIFLSFSNAFGVRRYPRTTHVYTSNAFVAAYLFSSRSVWIKNAAHTSRPLKRKKVYPKRTEGVNTASVIASETITLMNHLNELLSTTLYPVSFPLSSWFKSNLSPRTRIMKALPIAVHKKIPQAHN